MTPARRWSRTALVILQCAIVIGLCWVVFRNINLSDLFKDLQKVSLGSLALAAFFFFVERVVRPYRLAVLLGGTMRFTDVIALQSVSQVVNVVLPLRSGEIFLVASLRFLGHTSAGYALSVVAIDRLMDVACILAIFGFVIVAAFGVPDYVGETVYLLVVASALATAGMIAVVLTRSMVLARLESAIGRLAGPIRAKRWHSRFEQIIEGFSVLLDARRLLLALLATLVTWGCDMLASYVILNAIWPGAAVAAAVLAVCLSVIGMTVISVPAGIGVVHAAFAMAAVGFGATPETGLAFGIVTHFLATVTTILMGLGGLFVAKRAGLNPRIQMPAEIDQSTR